MQCFGHYSVTVGEGAGSPAICKRRDCYQTLDGPLGGEGPRQSGSEVARTYFLPVSPLFLLQFPVQQAILVTRFPMAILPSADALKGQVPFLVAAAVAAILCGRACVAWVKYLRQERALAEFPLVGAEIGGKSKRRKAFLQRGKTMYAEGYETVWPPAFAAIGAGLTPTSTRMQSFESPVHVVGHPSPHLDSMVLARPISDVEERVSGTGGASQISSRAAAPPRSRAELRRGVRRGLYPLGFLGATKLTSHRPYMSLTPKHAPKYA
jgi:hypothetical protein